MRPAILALALMGLNTTAHASSDVDYVEAYHSCDETAAFDYGFAEADLPQGEIAGSTIRQIAGQWKGQELLILAVPTSTGKVFCMTTLDYRVVQYKFNGRQIILRD